MLTITTRDLRTTLRALIQKGNPVLIGNRWHKRAILIPFKPRDWPPHEAARRARGKIRAALKALCPPT